MPQHPTKKVRVRHPNATPVADAVLAQAYLAGKTIREVCKEFHTSSERVREAVHDSGASTRHVGSHRKHTINLDAFANMESDPIKSYWAGFLFADGCVDDRLTSLILALAEEDRQHLEAFRVFAGSDALITTKTVTNNFGTQTMCRFLLCGRQLARSLARYGLTPAKSLIATVPEVFSNNPDWWRGCVDGDGWICCKKIGADSMPILGLCGSLDTVQHFREFVHGLNPGIRSKVLPNGAKCFKIQVAGTIAQSVIRALGYDRDTIALARKKILALRGLVWKPQHQSTKSSE